MQPAKTARRAGCINYNFKCQITALIVAQSTYYVIKLIKKGRTRNTLTLSLCINLNLIIRFVNTNFVL